MQIIRGWLMAISKFLPFKIIWVKQDYKLELSFLVKSEYEKSLLHKNLTGKRCENLSISLLYSIYSISFPAKLYREYANDKKKILLHLKIHIILLYIQPE